MKVDYDVKTFDGFFSELTFKRLSDYANEKLMSGDPVMYTNLSWEKNPNMNLDRFQKIILCHDIHRFDTVLTEMILCELENNLPGYKAYKDMLHLYYWTNGACIEWHSDGIGEDKRVGALTVYLNKKWEPEWGGDFLYKNQDGTETHRITPEENKGVFITDVLHRTTPVYTNNVRKCLQVWLEKDE